MILVIDSHPYHYEVEALCRMFLHGKELQICEGSDIPAEEDYVYTAFSGHTMTVKAKIDGKFSEAEEPISENEVLGFERLIYRVLSELTGVFPKWGTLTGIRPVKLVMALHDQGLSDEKICEKLRSERLVSDEKLSLLLETMHRELPIRSLSKPESVSIYISIPFCPSRCSYCSFTSHSIEKAARLIPQYVELLCKELENTAVLIKDLGLHLETVYMGGGTPTVLTAEQLDRVLSTVNRCFDMKDVRELTVEAGRPDTITAEKLSVMRKNRVGRISINPQTMNDDVLKAVGRRHTAADIVDAYRLARTFDFESINMDLISGLPGDTFEKFQHTVDAVLALEPDNITLHTLTVKHGADLAPEYQSVFENTADRMNEYAFSRFFEAGYFPYYLYRQKGTIDNLENTGFCKPGKEGIYNVFIMDETHTILAAGAGGVTKMKAPNGPKIERAFNYKFPYEYVERYDRIREQEEQVRDFYARYPIQPDVER